MSRNAKKMKKIMLAAVMSLIFCVGFAGCDSEKVLGFLNLTSQEAPETVDKSETVIVALEDATGKTIPIEISKKGEVISGNVANLASKGQAVVKLIESLAPQAAPVTSPINSILQIISGLGVVAYGFFQRRKAKAAELETKTMIKAVDNVAGVGSMIKEAAALDGTAEGIKQKYVEVKANS